MEEKGNGPPWRTLEQISLYRKIFRLEITDCNGLEIRKYMIRSRSTYICTYVALSHSLINFDNTAENYVFLKKSVISL